MDFIKDAVSNVSKGQKSEGQKEEKKGESQDENATRHLDSTWVK